MSECMYVWLDVSDTSCLARRPDESPVRATTSPGLHTYRINPTQVGLDTRVDHVISRDESSAGKGVCKLGTTISAWPVSKGQFISILQVNDELSVLVMSPSRLYSKGYHCISLSSGILFHVYF